MRFLTGVVAGLSTRANDMGTVCRVEIAPAEIDLGNLIKGARSVSPDIEVSVEHLKDRNDFEGARRATGETRCYRLRCDLSGCR